MDEKLEGLTLEMKLDAMGVQEGMKGLKRQLGVVNSEMKANLSAFDKSEKSMEQYETKLNGLNKRLKVQKQMFNQAEGELKKLNANYQTAKIRIKDVEKAYLNLAEANKKNKAALDKSNTAMKESNAELKKSETQYKRTTQRKEEAYQKLKQLRQAEKDLKNSSSTTTAQLKRANEAVQKQSAKHKELVSRYKEEGAQVKKLRSENETLSNSNQKVKNTYNKTNTELKQAENEYKQLNNTIKNHNTNLAKAEKAVNNEKASLNSLERTISKTQSQMNAFNKEQLVAGSHFTKTANQADTMSKKFGSIGDKMTGIGRTMTVGVTTPITLGFGAAIKTSADFEQQISKVGAVSQASGSQLKQMSAQAVDLGAKTSKSASEVAEGMNELAQLGFNANQVMKAMPGVISAAEASGADMATTAQVMASSINAFNLKASDSSHVADMLAKASNDSAADISYMGEALKYAGTPAHALGVTMEDTSAAIEVMSNSGLKGEQAGTVLRASFIRLAKPTGEASKLMQQMGIHMTNNQGKFVGMGNLIGQFRTHLKGMTKEQKLATVSQIVGTEAASGFLALIDAGPDKINKYSNSLKNSDGASKKAANQMKNNLKGSIEQLKGAFESLGIQIGKDLTPAIRAGAHMVQGFVEGFSKMPGWVRKSAIGLALFGAAIGPVVLAGGLLIRAIGSAAEGYASLNRQMAINSAEAVTNASANKVAAGSLATSGKATKRSTGLFSKLGNVLSLATGRFGGLGKVALNGAKIFGKVGVPLTILTTIFGVAYEKMGWFRQGFRDMGRIVNEVGSSIDFSWLPNMGKAWDNFKNDMAKGLQDGLLFKGIHKLFNGIHSLASKASDKVNVLGKGVSKETRGALGSYVKYSEQSDKIFERIRYNHGNISKKEAEELISINKKMGDELVSQLEKRKAREIKLDHDVLDNSKAISSKRKQAILQRANEEGNVRIQKAKELNKRITALEAKATKDGKLSKQETKELQKLYDQRNNLAVKSLSKGEKEQQRILSRMSANRKAMSIQEASETIKESIKSRDQAIKDAKRRYDAKVDEINQMVGLSKTEKNKLLNEAQDQYDKEKSKANKHHQNILKDVKKSNKNVASEIDTSNGKVRSGWSKHWHKLVEDSKSAWNRMGKNAKNFGKMMGGVGDWFKGLGKKTNNAWSSMSSSISKHSKSAYGSAKNWLGKTTKNAGDNFNKAKNSASKNWEHIGSTIASKSKSAFNNAKSWLGKTTNNAKSNFNSAKNSASKNWGHIGSTVASKAKSVYSHSKSWLGKTASNARSNFGNMLSNARKKWGGISSTAWSNAKSVWRGTSKWFGNAYGSLRGWMNNMTKKSRDKWDSISSTAWSNAKTVWRGTSKWFGNAYGSLKGWMNNMSKKAHDKWDYISSTAWSNAKSVYRGTSKWFGNAYGSLKSWTGKMADKAHDRFDKISSDAWSNAKSVYNGFHQWLSRTLSWIRNIGKDMGDAALSLGKTVANNAIGGLNGMIGGINKIAKAITDKTLIKPIPKLATGTFDGSSVATDSNGGLTAPTLAVVNDRGSGNAPGGGVQEVIHRADGTLHAPQGRDVVVPLGVGDSVINARDTKKMQNMGMLPRFASGTHTKRKSFFDAVGSSFQDFASRSKDTGHKALDGIGGKAKKATKSAGKAAEKVANGVKSAVETGKDAAESAMKGIKGIVDNVEDYIEKPGKLVDLVMSKMNINFGSGANTTVTMAKLAYQHLKKALVEKVKSWFEEFGGGGGYNPFADNPSYHWVRGWTPTGHAGIDYAASVGTKIPSPLDGTVIKSWQSPWGGGNETQVYDGSKYTHIFMHQSKRGVSTGDKVHQGQIIGLTGNTGNSTGPHLHWQVNKGKGFLNNHPDSINPLEWVKQAAKAGGKGGINKAASAWASDIRRAAAQMHTSVSASDVRNIVSLIQHESGGNAGITQGNTGDINNALGTPAQGLLQYVPSTFRNYAVRGHGNIKSGYDQLLAFFNNKYWRSQFNPMGGWSPSGPRRYANGGLITKHQIAEIGEGNKPEMVVPLTRRTRAIQLIEQAMRYVGMDAKSTNVTVNNDNSLIEKLLKQMVAMNDHNNRLTATIVDLLKSSTKGADPRKAEQLLSQLQGDRYARTAYNTGG
ncbi:phage tail tape measure protein [Staphylococcus warneri]|uniref:phage tail tape measure protein n=1 Tax=Staphylococcus warneri TaxID=1292 RepID=UPI001FB47B4D|nr:phage tail tape measure protein [Staphylococcus warneri]MCJ1786290.1 phage tail tape measure protein [Staphylococcus warneri]MCJ1788775.1 phage tail tape measure protein [Staphylococcus warneri]MCJ1791203.1 phage tail tape measure protein [Staphylococcus warneri]MCJ1793662.1 phage tail tape measure protein [Staphylococcus warneri]MCJ1796121.1 phage tail tape measure protein [Staphylococcus warneri]